jgi:hypothetical protein
MKSSFSNLQLKSIQKWKAFNIYQVFHSYVRLTYRLGDEQEIHFDEIHGYRFMRALFSIRGIVTSFRQTKAGFSFIFSCLKIK